MGTACLWVDIAALMVGFGQVLGGARAPNRSSQWSWVVGTGGLGCGRRQCQPDLLAGCSWVHHASTGANQSLASLTHVFSSVLQAVCWFQCDLSARLPSLPPFPTAVSADHHPGRRLDAAPAQPHVQVSCLSSFLLMFQHCCSQAMACGASYPRAAACMLHCWHTRPASCTSEPLCFFSPVFFCVPTLLLLAAGMLRRKNSAAAWYTCPASCTSELQHLC